MTATLVALYLVMTIYGAGDLRGARDPVAAPRPAAQDAGREALMPAGQDAAQPDAAAARPTDPDPAQPAPEIVQTTAQTPQRVQEFPGPPLRPSPEYVGQTPDEAAPPPQGAQGPILYVTGSSVNFRAGPSTGDRVIGALGQGDAVEALGPTDAAWVHIRDTAGRIGYMSGQFLSPAQPD